MVLVSEWIYFNFDICSNTEESFIQCLYTHAVCLFGTFTPQQDTSEDYPSDILLALWNFLDSWSAQALRAGEAEWGWRAHLTSTVNILELRKYYREGKVSYATEWIPATDKICRFLMPQMCCRPKSRICEHQRRKSELRASIVEMYPTPMSLMWTHLEVKCYFGFFCSNVCTCPMSVPLNVSNHKQYIPMQHLWFLDTRRHLAIQASSGFQQWVLFHHLWFLNIQTEKGLSSLARNALKRNKRKLQLLCILSWWRLTNIYKPMISDLPAGLQSHNIHGPSLFGGEVWKGWVCYVIGL